ncbi:putative harbinger transposase-derived protein [Helianthus annuus]|nr:putative harbinger transposase-derived protein [Helianthus annuus]
MSARTAWECLYRFCHNVVKLYSKQYLRKPNAYDVQQLYHAHEARHRFPGMLGSIDCMHWEWHNCPTAWRGQYTRGDHGHPTLILRPWRHKICGSDILSLGSLVHSTTSTCYTNRRSLAMPLMEPVRTPVLQFQGLSIDAGIILLTEYIRLGLQLSRQFHIPRTKKGKKSPSVKKLQEKTSNVVLVFTKKWVILQQPARAFTPKRLRLCMYACLLLHNMIIEDEGRDTGILSR